MKMTFNNLEDATQYIMNISTAGATNVTLDISKGNYIVRCAMSDSTLLKLLGV